MIPVADVAALALTVRAAERRGGLDEPARAATERALARLRAGWGGLAPDARADLAAAVTRLVARRDALPGAPAGAAGPGPADDPLGPVLRALGIQALRPGQDVAISAALSGRDAILVMATGAGKSLCYQAPGLGAFAFSLVVSPLVALIDDQVARLRRAGLAAAGLHSEMPAGEARAVLEGVAAGRVRLLYCAPERFDAPGFTDLVRRRGLDLLAIDEAHCISEWGHEFRPAYQRLGRARAAVGPAGTLALTATATPQVQADIVRHLGLRDPLRIVSGFDRPNLVFDTWSLSGRGTARAKWDLLAAALRSAGDVPVVVYTGTRRGAEEAGARLRAEGHAAASYHAGRDDRPATQAAFMDGRVRVLCATNAFGQGVDKADIRLVVHTTMPDSLEQWYQEAGRAGRDGEPARALLIAADADVGTIRRRIAQARIDPAEVERHLARAARVAGPEGTFRLGREAADDAGRFALSMAERVGALTLLPAPGGGVGGRLHAARLTPEQADRVDAEVRREVKRRYRALEGLLAFAREPGCRRGHVLAHFGDPAPPAPEGRCCSACDPPADLAAALASARSTPERVTSAARDGDPLEALSAPERRLYERLRTWRAQLAAQLGWPAFRVAGTQTLIRIVRARPDDPAALRAISGVGPWLAQHAPAICAIVADPSAPVPSTAPPPPSPPSPAPRNDPAFEALRGWRRGRIDGAPAYTVCSDRVLREVLARRPAGLSDLRAVPGVGPAFCERHGPSLLEALRGLGAGGPDRA